MFERHGFRQKYKSNSSIIKIKHPRSMTSLIHRYNIAIQMMRKCQIKNFHARSQKNKRKKLNVKRKTAHTHILFPCTQ